MLQSEASECGLICLAFVSAKLGAHREVVELRQRFPVSSRGLTLKQIAEIASGLDMTSRAVKCALDEIAELKLPAILHWSLNHFVVLTKVSKKTVQIHDPAVGLRTLKHQELSEHFTGVALELSRAEGFKKRKEKSPLSIWQWVKITPEMTSGLVQVLILSLILQLYVLASPFYMQLAIDQAALKGDQLLLSTLAIGFGLFGLFNLGASVLRQWATQHLSIILSWDMSLRLFRHLVRLPLPWFQRRRLADTISRFDAINPIRDLVSGALISTLIDGVLAITTLVMMVIFSWWLAALTLFGVLLFIGVRLLTLQTELRLGAESLMAHIGENGKRIETIKAIQTVKIMSAETAQETQWSNAYADSLKKDLTAARFHIATGSVHQAFEVIISTLLVFFGAKAIIEAKMTVGILYAFMADKGQFTNAVVQIVEKLIQWKLSDIYSYRLADIVLHPREEGIDKVSAYVPEIKGDIEIDNLHFRYGPHETFVIKGLNLQIKAGEMVAIMGPSGAGKSTLLKLICGLYLPTHGEVRLDGRPLSAYGPRPLRQAIGVVMQDDELLSGTVADNVAFFDENINMERVWWALEAVALKDEILAMPMKAESFVGDMGGALSGGQKQRLLLARCLYKNPLIVFLDEATSHLDQANENIINQTLTSMNITRVVIAHRRETIQAADRLFDLSKGSFV